MEEGKSSIGVVSVGREEGRGVAARRLCGKKGEYYFIGTQCLLHHMKLYFWPWHKVPVDRCTMVWKRGMASDSKLEPQSKTLGRYGRAFSIPWCSWTQAIPRELRMASRWCLRSRWCFHIAKASGLVGSCGRISTLPHSSMVYLSSVCFSLVIKESLFWQL